MKQSTELKVKKALGILKSVSHPKRFFILNYIRENKDVCQKDIVKLLDIDQPTISHHLSILKRYGVIGFKKKGKFAYFHVNEDRLGEIIDVINVLGK